MPDKRSGAILIEWICNQKSKWLKCVNILDPSAILSFFVRFFTFFMSSYVSSNAHDYQFYCNRLRLLVFGITPTFLCKFIFKAIWPGVLPYFVLNSWIKSSFNTFAYPSNPEPRPSGVWANTWTPFFCDISTKLGCIKYGWDYIWSTIGFILQIVNNYVNNWPLKLLIPRFLAYPFLTHS